MIQRYKRVIGWIAADAMTAEQAADEAIAKCREVLGRSTGVIHMDSVTGRVTLYADTDTPAPPGTFVRGVRWDSDPGILADDLRSEALEHRLIAGYAGHLKAKAAGRRA